MCAPRSLCVTDSSATEGSSVTRSAPVLHARHIARRSSARDALTRATFPSRERGGSHFETSSQKAKSPMGEIIYKTKGKIKQVAGALAGNDKLKAEGEIDELKGAVKGAVEDIKHASKR